ncbi:hypothetical protein KN1_12320 [Stygiolobus caldivivus]|uniref:Uncharacterized protein n=1 Tax=Stygiolobus caldivivus TaxID=2824673 RepID=A0A8D5U6F3_9CREN|nr:hypothetical protein KN1_12320 [Stygiolobus caldivivus]
MTSILAVTTTSFNKGVEYKRYCDQNLSTIKIVEVWTYYYIVYVIHIKYYIVYTYNISYIYEPEYIIHK